MASAFPLGHRYRAVPGHGSRLKILLTASESVDYYDLKREIYQVFNEIGEIVPFGKESQTLQPSSMPIQKAKNGVGGRQGPFHKAGTGEKTTMFLPWPPHPPSSAAVGGQTAKDPQF